MNSRLTSLLLCLTVSAAAFAGGWWQAHSSQPAASPAPVSAVSPAAQPDWMAPRSEWRSRWQDAPPAQRDVLLQGWIERDPHAALLFLYSLPPDSIGGQDELEKQAFLAWSRRDPPSAYTFAVVHRRFHADNLLEEAFKTDPEAALRMLESRCYRDSCHGGGNDWINADPAHASQRLAALPSGIKQDSLLQAALQEWGKKDADAALKFALTLPEYRAAVAISGLLEKMPAEQAAGIVLQLKNAEHQKAAVWRLMVDWGRKEPGAALAWAAENLPPDAMQHAMECFAYNVITQDDAFKATSRTEVLAALPPSAWLAFPQDWASDRAVHFAGAAPDWFLPRVVEKLPGSTASLAQWAENEDGAEWFTALPAERAEQIVESFAKRETAQDKLPALSSVPEAWRAATARGMIKQLAATGTPEHAPQLPPAERALLRAQLTAADSAATHYEALRRWLE